MALPLCITSNIIFFSKYEWFRVPDDRKNNPTRMDRVRMLIPQHNDDVREDIRKSLKVFYYRIESGDSGWRTDFMVYAHVIPLVCLCFDMVLNRIRMRSSHVLFLILIMTIYLGLASNIGIYLCGNAGVYFDNLRFKCD